MRMEKVNDNQIRCIITQEDLKSQRVTIAELTTGSDKAKKFIVDMMKKAEAEFGFKTDNTPLMVEAIPISSESFMIVITKGDDAKKKLGEMPQKPEVHRITQFDGFDIKLNGLEAIDPLDENGIDIQATKIYSFDDFNNLTEASRNITDVYKGLSTLLKDTRHGYDEYILLLYRDTMDFNDFNRISNALTEYSDQIPASKKYLAILSEHCETLIESNAIDKLSKM